MKHHFWMLIACLVPLLLIFLLPAAGVGGSGLFALLLFGCFFMHLFMMRGHDHDGDKKGGGEKEKKQWM